MEDKSERHIELEGYVQGSKQVKDFRSGNYEVVVQEMPESNNAESVVRFKMILIIPGKNSFRKFFDFTGM